MGTQPLFLNLVRMLANSVRSNSTKDGTEPSRGNSGRRRGSKNSTVPRNSANTKKRAPAAVGPTTSAPPQPAVDDVLALVGSMPDYFQGAKRATFGRITLEILHKEITLSPRLLHVLAYLIRKQPRWIPKKELENAIGLEPGVKDHRIPLIISGLRAALRRICIYKCIETKYGGGYRFLPPVNH